MTTNRGELIREAYRRSEERLNVQQALAIAADSRALTFCGLMFAAAAILAGLSEGAANTSGLFLTSGMFVVSAALAGWSARPVEFGAAGGRFGSLQDDITCERDICEVLEQLGSFHDEHIQENEIIMTMNGRLMRASYWFAVLSPLPWAINKCFFS